MKQAIACTNVFDLDLPGWHVLKHDRIDKDWHLVVETDRAALVRCPECDGDDLYRRGSREHLYRDLPVYTNRVGLIIKRHRYSCRACGHLFYQPLPELDDKRHATKRLVEYVQQESLRRTFLHIAEETGLHEKTIRNIFRDFAADLSRTRPVIAPEILGIDEVYIKRRYLCVFTDLQHKRIINMYEGQPEKKRNSPLSKTSVGGYLYELQDRRNVQVVCTDMSAAYRQAVRHLLPYAVLVIDRFHVQKLVDEAADKIRKKFSQSRSSSTQGKTVPGRKKDDATIFKTPVYELTVNDKLRMEVWEHKYPLLLETYYFKEKFHRMWMLTDRKRAEEKYREWRRSVPPHLAPIFKTVIETIDKWHKPIFAYFDHPEVTNSYTDMANGLIKLANRIGRGYSFEMLRAKMVHGASERASERERPKGFKRRKSLPDTQAPNNKL